jgi:hypothetical protein
MTTRRIIYALALSALLSGWAVNGYAQTATRHLHQKPPDAGTCPLAEPSLQGAWRVTFAANPGVSWQLPPHTQRSLTSGRTLQSDQLFW